MLEINAEIESFLFDSYDFNFDENFNKIDNLIHRCSAIDYLNGESELIQLKIGHAIALGKEDLIYEWLDNYNKKKKELYITICTRISFDC